MLKNMKIGKKLILTFVLITIISSIAGIVGLSSMTYMNSSYSNALTNYGFSQGDIGLFHSQFNGSRAIIRDIIFSTDTGTMNTSSAELTAVNEKINTYLTNMKKTMKTEKEISYYNNIKTEFTKYVESENQIIALVKENFSTDAFKLFESETNPLAEKIETEVSSLIALKTTTGNQISANLSAQSVTATVSMIAIILIAIVLSLIIALKIARSISKPVKIMAAAAHKMEEGDLGVQILVDSKDEIGQLGAAFSGTIKTINTYITDIKNILANVEQGDLTATSELQYKGDFSDLQMSIRGLVSFFNDTVMQMNNSAEQVSSGSAQVSDGAQELAQGATEQASSIEELSASISEISNHVSDNAAHAANASMNVNQVSSEIEISNQHMKDMVAAMSKISESSSQIGKIIKAIEDIAFQTNILALNAAVEAARAGEAGKGFAVVADEVRNLASKSAEAAKNTTSLIENSMLQVENGTKIADETAKSLLKVVESTKVVADNVDQISKASSQQANSIGQVTLGVEQISSVVQTNSATAEQSAAASEELSGQAQIMKELVGKFKLSSIIESDAIDNSEPQQPKSEEILEICKY